MKRSPGFLAVAASPTDEQISKMAKARVSFKMHALVYVLVNLFLAAVWFATSVGDGTPYWPMWTHFGWGIGLAVHGFTAYGAGSQMLEREEERLRRHGKA